MASESGDSNMDREMILADFQVCLFSVSQILRSAVSILSASVELPRFVVNNSSQDPAAVVNSRPELNWAEPSSLWLAHQANELTAC